MSKKVTLVLLFCIVVLASVLRLWQLGEVPPSPDWDEVALGYNAYSIMQTGKDEYGKFLPIILRSFDDYKPALYVYLVIPAVKLFGLTVFAVRFPSVVVGILTVIATYFVVKELMSFSNKYRNKDLLPLLSAFFLAISPWHIQFSRIAFEANTGLALNIFSALFFLKGLRNKTFLFFSILCMSLSLYVYQSEKGFVPFLFLSLVSIFRAELFSLPRKYLLAVCLLGVVVATPLVYVTLSDKANLTRAKGVSVFTEETPVVHKYAQRIIEDKENNDFFGLIVDNRRVAYAKAVLANYLAHYDAYWLFLSGDLNRHHAPEMGLLYLFELPFLLIGIYHLLFGNFDKKIKLFIFSWFLIAPIPASISTGVPHAVRTLNFLPIFQIFTSIGLLHVYFFIKQKITLQVAKLGAYFLIFLFFTFNFLYFLNQYFVQQNYFFSQAWQYGYKEAVDIVREKENKYDKIIVSNKPHLDQSYIFFLFYLQYPPSFYQKEAVSSSGGFRENHAFGKFEFRPIDWNMERKDIKRLYVGLPKDFPDNVSLLKTIFFLDGEPAIKIVEG